ncbi:MAG: SDR family NAD(P)-dependent oxidoreductase [Actinobacteria bacterium]|nr:SDR family NAD(P)-dependent oxidoreductase [Actinomycetota bacterium]MBO0834431.1 SDR family NAD(P)-dependent oxidoreductase [Actinomycetota bacterium]
MARSGAGISGNGRPSLPPGNGLAFLTVRDDNNPPQISLAGRVALVTGGSGGIGRATALALSSAGVSVAIGYGANDAAAHELAGQITAAGGRAAALSADLASATEIARLTEEAEESFGHVDVLVSNAGSGKRQPLEAISVQDFDASISVNLRAPFLLAQRLVPAMARRGFGRVLFLSSVAAFTGGVIGPHYAASKAGLHGLTHSLAARFADDGVTVNAIAPALVTETGMLPGEPDELRQRVPVGRLGRPAEIADLALAVLRNPYLTNQVISIDGGIYPR